VQFQTRDPVTNKSFRTKGWWIPTPAPSPRLAVLLHGYTDAKVGAIAWAPMFVSMGFNVLALDLRAHGESDGVFCTSGFLERHDISQVIDQALARWPAQTRQRILFGVSLGAAVVAAVAVDRGDIDAVMMECPYVDFPHAVMSHVDKLGVPGRSVQRVALWMCQKIAGIDYSQVRPIDLIPAIPCPLWVVQVNEDPFVPAKDRRALAAAVASRPEAAGPSVVWEADAYHVLAMNQAPEEYRRRLAAFLHAALPTPLTAEGQLSDTAKFRSGVVGD